MLLFIASPRIITLYYHFANISSIIFDFVIEINLFLTVQPVPFAKRVTIHDFAENSNFTGSFRVLLLTPESLSGLADQRVISQAVNSNFRGLIWSFCYEKKCKFADNKQIQ